MAALAVPSLDEADREAALRTLARQLQFKVERSGGRFTLTRTADVSRPVREGNLTLTEAEKLLDTWSCAARTAAEYALRQNRYSRMSSSIGSPNTSSPTSCTSTNGFRGAGGAFCVGASSLAGTRSACDL